MRLAVVSHKPCWPSTSSPSGYATDGGFPYQMRALSELFDETKLVVPCSGPANRSGEVPLRGINLRVAPLATPGGKGIWRKLGFFFWMLSNGPVLLREIWRCDVAHTPIPSDVGTIGMLLAFVLQKPLLVRHCGNWFVQRTAAERFWKWFMERFAGGRNVMLATGGAALPPSTVNSKIRWIFSTSMTGYELEDYSRRRIRSTGAGPKLIIVCRQEKGKGTDIVIKSLPLILGQFPGVTLDVVGDGGALVEFKESAAVLGLSDRVNFHGNVGHAQVIELLLEADLFCFPTASEGFPKTVLEALACGVPVVTTRVSVLPHLLGADCGYLIEEATPAAIADAVCACLSDKPRYEIMSAQAILRARQYSLEEWRDTIGNMLRTICGPLRSHA